MNKSKTQKPRYFNIRKYGDIIMHQIHNYKKLNSPSFYLVSILIHTQNTFSNKGILLEKLCFLCKLLKKGNGKEKTSRNN